MTRPSILSLLLLGASRQAASWTRTSFGASRLLVLLCTLALATAGMGCARYTHAPDMERMFYDWRPFDGSSLAYLRTQTGMIHELDMKVGTRQPIPIRVGVAIVDKTQEPDEEFVLPFLVPGIPFQEKKVKAFRSPNLMAVGIASCLRQTNAFIETADTTQRENLDAVLWVNVTANRVTRNLLSYGLLDFTVLLCGALGAPLEFAKYELEAEFALALLVRDPTTGRRDKSHVIWSYKPQMQTIEGNYGRYYGHDLNSMKWKMVGRMVNDVRAQLKKSLPEPRDPIWVCLEHPKWLTMGPTQPTSLPPGLPVPPLPRGWDDASRLPSPAVARTQPTAPVPTAEPPRTAPPAPRPAPPPAPPPAPSPAPKAVEPPPPPPPPEPAPPPAPRPAAPSVPAGLNLDPVGDETFSATIKISGTFGDPQGVETLEIVLDGTVVKTLRGDEAMKFAEEISVAPGKNRVEVVGRGKGGVQKSAFTVVRYQ